MVSGLCQGPAWLARERKGQRVVLGPPDIISSCSMNLKVKEKQQTGKSSKQTQEHRRKLSQTPQTDCTHTKINRTS